MGGTNGGGALGGGGLFQCTHLRPCDQLCDELLCLLLYHAGQRPGALLPLTAFRAEPARAHKQADRQTDGRADARTQEHTSPQPIFSQLV